MADDDIKTVAPDEESETTLPKIELVPVRWDVCETDEPGMHGIPRDWREDMFHETLATLGISSYGYAEEGEAGEWLKPYEVDGDCGDGLSPHYEIRTPLFVFRPFYWGDDDAVYGLPNFEWLPWHLEISWYKWPLRDGRSNIALSDDDWREMCSQMTAWAEAVKAGEGFEEPEACDRRSEADIWAEEWRRRIRRANDVADRHWESLMQLLDALSVPEVAPDDEDADVLPNGSQMAESIQSAIDAAAKDTEWGMFLDDVQKRIELVDEPLVRREENGDGTIRLTLRTRFFDSDE